MFEKLLIRCGSRGLDFSTIVLQLMDQNPLGTNGLPLIHTLIFVYLSSPVFSSLVFVFKTDAKRDLVAFSRPLLLSPSLFFLTFQFFVGGGVREESLRG